MSRRAVPILLCLVFAAYVAMLLRNTCYFAAGPDSSGYLNEARMLAHGELRVAIEPLRTFGLDAKFADIFVPLGFARHAATEMTPTYPPGLPLHMALFAAIGGWRIAPYLVTTFAAIAALLLVYAIGRELQLPKSLAIAGAAILAASPIFMNFAMQPMSDLVACVWALAAIYAALVSRRSPNVAFAAGIAFAVGVWVRPTNALLALALLFALPLRVRQLLATFAGALPFVVALGAVNALQYGRWYRTGYGTPAEQIALRPLCFDFHTMGTLRMLTPLVVVAAVFVILCVRRVAWNHRAMLVAWFAAFFLFYSWYGYCELWLSSRFLLPAFPALVIAAMLTLDVVRTFRFGRGVTIAAIVIMLTMLARTGSKLRVFRIDDYESIFPQSVRLTEERAPSNALIVSGVLSGAFYYGGHWTARWDRLEPATFATLRDAASSRHLPIYATISDKEVTPAEFHRRLPGTWTPVGRARDVTLFRFDG
jgi:hypothetical protein